jgi:hypothetical protein
VFQVVRGYSTGVYTNDEFKSKLKNINLSNLDNYREHIKTLIKNALKEEVVVEELDDVIVIKEHAATDKPVVSRKRNYKTNNEVVETE